MFPAAAAAQAVGSAVAKAESRRVENSADVDTARAGTDSLQAAMAAGAASTDRRLSAAAESLRAAAVLAARVKAIVRRAADAAIHQQRRAVRRAPREERERRAVRVVGGLHRVLLVERVAVAGREAKVLRPPDPALGAACRGRGSATRAWA